MKKEKKEKKETMKSEIKELGFGRKRSVCFELTLWFGVNCPFKAMQGADLRLTAGART